MLRAAGKRVALRLRAADAARSMASTPGQHTPTAAAVTAAAKSAAAAAGPRIKTAEQLSPEELAAALPSAMFTTSNVVLSTLGATAVAGVGLVSVFWFASFIRNTAEAMKQQQAPPPPPPPPKTLKQLIEERRAELETELVEVTALPRTREVRTKLAELRAELRQLSPPRPWWSWWRGTPSSSSSSSSGGGGSSTGSSSGPAVAAAGSAGGANR